MATIRYDRGKSLVYGVDVDGKEIRKTFSRTRYGSSYKQLAEQLFAQLIDKTDTTTHAHRAAAMRYRQIRFRDLARRYVDQYLLTSESRSSNHKYYVETLILKWGDHTPATMTKQAFKEWILYALDHPIKRRHNGIVEEFKYEPVTLRHLVECASAIFEWAKGRSPQIIHENPLKGILSRHDQHSLSKHFRRRIRVRKVVLSDEDLAKVVAAMPRRRARPILFARATGMRRGEVCNLRWSDIQNGIAYIEAGDTKEVDFKRHVLRPEALRILEEIEIERITGGAVCEYVFTNDKGARLTENSLSATWRWYCNLVGKDTGCDRYRAATLHRLRNGYVTEELLNSTPVELLSEQVGHHAVDMTRRYFVVDNERLRALLGSPDNMPAPLQDAIATAVDQAMRSEIPLETVLAGVRDKYRKERHLPIIPDAAP